MEYNFLLLEDNKLSIQKNETFLQLNQENLDSLKEDYSVIQPMKLKAITLFPQMLLNFSKIMKL